MVLDKSLRHEVLAGLPLPGTGQVGSLVGRRSGSGCGINGRGGLRVGYPLGRRELDPVRRRAGAIILGIVSLLCLGCRPKDITHGEVIKLAHYAGISFAAPNEPKGCTYLGYNVETWSSTSGVSTGKGEMRASAQTKSGGDWLGLSTARPWIPGQFCVYLKPEGIRLAQGSYWGTITLLGATENKLYVDVSLKVCRIPVPTPRPSEIAFDCRTDSPPPACQRVQIDISETDAECRGAIPPQFAIKAATDTGGDWLRTEGANNVCATQQNLRPGTYSGSITASCTNCTAADSPRAVVPVRITVNPRPGAPIITAVLNGASLLHGVSAGCWITVRGESLSTQPARIWTGADFEGPRLPASLQDVRVLLNDVPCPVRYVSDSEIDALVPADFPAGPALLVVSNSHDLSLPVTLEVKKYAPEFFRLETSNRQLRRSPADAGTRRYAAAFTPEGALVGGEDILGGKTTPVKPGHRIMLHGTGFGPTEPPPPPNALFPQPLPLESLDKLSIRIGGLSAAVERASLTSPGVYQLHVVLPDLEDGEHPVVAEIDGAASEGTIHLTVRR